MKEKKIIIGIVVVIIILAIVAGVWAVLQPKEENQNTIGENQNLLANEEEDPNFDINLKEDGTKDDKIKT